MTPFLKWPGGKRSLLPSILPRLPERIEHYVEPFLGGGAVFFELARLGRLKGRVTLSDRNPDLINAWQMVQQAPEELADLVDDWPVDEDSYYDVRSLEPAGELERGARVVYLSRTCFNGLYRLNAHGRFNVPYGGHGRVINLVDRENLRACSEALKGVELRVGDFAEALNEIGQGAVVYCDPPYWPVKPRSFVAYDGCAFSAADHQRLALRLQEIGKLGAVALLSNADLQATRMLYRGLRVEAVSARRSISRNAKGRGIVGELLVTTAADLTGACLADGSHGGA